MTRTSDKPIIISDGTMDVAEHITMAHGELTFYSTRSPAKYTPNEDSLAIIPVDNHTLVLVVADGMGGMPAGEQASQIIVHSLSNILSKKPESQTIRNAIIEGIDIADAKIKDLKNGSGSTVSVAEISGTQIRNYHVGDSLTLLTSNHGNIKYVSMAHSPIGYALECGAIDHATAMKHLERNLITNYVGCHEMFIHIGPIIELASLDTLIIASDALSDNLYEHEISEHIRKGPLLESIEEMKRTCQNNMLIKGDDRLCHPDDFTFIAFRQASKE